MDDLISRQAAIDAIENCEPGEELFMIENLPAAQPDVIRCKDCKWKQGSECVRFADVRPFPDDFCSRAERKTDE